MIKEKIIDMLKEKISTNFNVEITLNNFNCKVLKGQMATIIVPGGKNAIIKLLMENYSDNSINIRINGKLISNYTIKELRKLVLYLPKEPYIFDGTIMENIKNGRINVSEREIVAASRAANALKFILDQPKGYNTIIGEKGVRLSAEQRQQIAIVRAILTKAPILLLDDATSVLGIEIENQVKQGMKALVKDKVILIMDSSSDNLDVYEIKSDICEVRSNVYV